MPFEKVIVVTSRGSTTFCGLVILNVDISGCSQTWWHLAWEMKLGYGRFK